MAWFVIEQGICLHGVVLKLSTGTVLPLYCLHINNYEHCDGTEL